MLAELEAAAVVKQVTRPTAQNLRSAMNFGMHFYCEPR
jgi:hypothetical protein